MTTPAQELRQAAQHIRDTVAGVQATPWSEREDDQVWQLRGGVAAEFQIIKAPKKSREYAEYWPNKAERQHILTWQPDTALLVAKWLDEEANGADSITQESPYGIAGQRLVYEEGEVSPCLRLARAINERSGQ